MKCPKCKHDLPDGSTFCQYCGINIEEWQANNNTCPSCGKELPKDSAFCQYCGQRIKQTNEKELIRKAKNNKKISFSRIVVFSIGTIILALLALNIFQYSNYNKIKSEYESLNTELKKSEDRRAALAIENQDCWNEISELESQLYFYEKYVVFVDDNGTQKYHMDPNCVEFDSSNFWAYNITAAEDLGYSPCPKCYKDRATSLLEEFKAKNGSN